MREKPKLLVGDKARFGAGSVIAVGAVASAAAVALSSRQHSNLPSSDTVK